MTIPCWAGISSTVTVQDAATPSASVWAVTTAVPAEMALTAPASSTAATAGSLLLQVIPSLVTVSGSRVAVSVMTFPRVIWSWLAFSVMPVG